MKILLLITVGFFSGVPFAVKAQGTLKPIKFINDIRLVPGSSSGQNNEINNTTIAERQVIHPIAASNNLIEKCSALQFKYALLLDTEVEAVTNLKLYDFIDSWMATRYRYGGTSQDGIDCSAFSSTLIGNVYNKTIPRTAKEQYDDCAKITREDLQEGDLVFFNTRGGVSHVGVYLCNGYFVHSSSHDGVTINNLSDDYYHRKFIGGGRVALN